MGRIVLVVMAISILAYLGYRSMYGGMPGAGGEAPKQRLDNVKKAANRIEENEAKALEETLKKAAPQD